MSFKVHDPSWNDIRKITHQTRIQIGYEDVRDSWKEAKAYYTDNTLTICNHPVMERWEENYMRALADVATRNEGIILEVGFGMGISATFIQRNSPEKHIIIEANKDVIAQARRFAAEAPSHVILLEGFWEDVISQIEDNVIDGILFDTYPLCEEEIHTNHFPFFQEAHRILKKGGILTYYSDEIDSYSETHINRLNEAGFNNIEKDICEITPPEECQYWKSKSLLVPVVTK